MYQLSYLGGLRLLGIISLGDSVFPINHWISFDASNCSGVRYSVEGFCEGCGLELYLVAHPTARKWVSSPPDFSGLTLLIPFITGVITHLRAVGSSPPSTTICGGGLRQPTCSLWCRVMYDAHTWHVGPYTTSETVRGWGQNLLVWLISAYFPIYSWCKI